MKCTEKEGGREGGREGDDYKSVPSHAAPNGHSHNLWCNKGKRMCVSNPDKENEPKVETTVKHQENIFSSDILAENAGCETIQFTNIPETKLLDCQFRPKYYKQKPHLVQGKYLWLQST